MGPAAAASVFEGGVGSQGSLRFRRAVGPPSGARLSRLPGASDASESGRQHRGLVLGQERCEMIGYSTQMGRAGPPKGCFAFMRRHDIEPSSVFGGRNPCDQVRPVHSIDQPGQAALRYKDVPGQIGHPQTLGTCLGQLHQNVVETYRKTDFLQLIGQDVRNGVMGVEEGAPGCKLVLSGSGFHHDHCKGNVAHATIVMISKEQIDASSDRLRDS